MISKENCGCWLFTIGLLLPSLLGFSRAQLEAQTSSTTPQLEGIVGVRTLGNAIGTLSDDFTADARDDLLLFGGSVGLQLFAVDSSGAWNALAPATSVSGSIVDVVSADFDADGEIDVAMLSLDGSVRLARGDGLGGFDLGPSLLVGGVPRSLSAGDFNQDGALDLAVACLFLDRVELALNDGFGTLTLGIPIRGVASPSASVSIDIDNDGDVDVAVINSDANSLSLARNNGSGTFSVEPYVAGNLPRELAIADFDNDGRLDAVVACESQTTYLAGSSGVFEFPTTIENQGGLVDLGSVDFNADGNADFFGMRDGRLQLYQGSGDGTFLFLAEALRYGSGGASAWADLDADTSLEVAVAVTAGAVFLELDGSGFVEPEALSLVDPSHLVLADFDVDGYLDYAIARDNGFVVGLGDGNRFTELAAEPNDASDALAVADFNADGLPDVAGLNAAIVTISLGRGTGSFDLPTSFSVAAGALSLAVGDLDGDGREDLALGYDGRVELWFVEAVGTFCNAGTLALAESVSDLRIVDLDGGGENDLLVASGTEIQLWRNNGSGGLGLQSTQEVGFAIAQLLAEDLDGELGLDVVVRELAGQGRVQSYIQSAAGSLELADEVARPEGIGEMIGGDFDVDGLSDLLVQVSDSWIELLQGSGDGLLTPRGRYFASADGGLQLGDLDRDGDPDGLAASALLDRVSILRNITTLADCNQNGVADVEEILNGLVLDLNDNNVPDSCEAGFFIGDVDANDSIDLLDAVAALEYLFLGMPVACAASLDFNRNGVHDVSDVIAELRYVFGIGSPPPSPFPGCALAVAGSPLSCEVTACP